MNEIPIAHPRYSAYAGFVTTPQYFDDSPQQFLQVAPRGTGVLQRVNHIPGYAYELGGRASNFDLLEESAVCLARGHRSDLRRHLGGAGAGAGNLRYRSTSLPASARASAVGPAGTSGV
jgi:hypothetical protein